MASNVKVDKITPTTNCGTVTLGDSGDTISIPSGASLSIGGSVSGIDGVVNWDTTAKTTAFTAVAGTGYFVDTTSAAITVTLPASPTAGDMIGVKDYAFTADTNNITLARNGSNIQGVANDFIINTEGRSVTLIYVDATQGWLLTGASQASDITDDVFITATGGTVITCGNYKTHIFTGPGTFCVSAGAGPVAVVDYFVVAGGGGGSGNNGGGSIGGGAGAGGFRLSNSPANAIPAPTMSPLANSSGAPVTVQGYPITVGAGGAAGVGTPGPPNCGYPGCKGSDSIFSTITSAGGGRSDGNICQNSGGSGGGSNNLANVCGSGNTPPVSPPQGNDGGYNPVGTASPGFTRGGGGGAGAAGQNSPSNSQGGNGGAGSYLADAVIGPTAPSYGEPGPVGSTRYFAGGGGAAIHNNPPASAGDGGVGGGGDGVGGTGTGGSGVVNTGGGGGSTGGASYGSCTPQTGGAGGSGIVILRYKFQ